LISHYCPGTYVIEGDNKYSNFVASYVWSFFEVTRLIQVGTTFGMEKPTVRPVSWLGGAPILLFKLITVAVGFKLLATIWAITVDTYRGDVLGP
jgi:hypothetical protein